MAEEADIKAELEQKARDAAALQKKAREAMCNVYM